MRDRFNDLALVLLMIGMILVMVLMAQRDFRCLSVSKDEVPEQYAPTVERCVADCQKMAASYIHDTRGSIESRRLNYPPEGDSWYDPSKWVPLYQPATGERQAYCICVSPHGQGSNAW